MIELRPKIPAKLIPTVLLHTRVAWFTEKEKVHTKHQEKLNNLSIDQDRPIAKIKKDTITILDNIKDLPEYVIATLAKGPKYPVLSKIDEKATAAKINALIKHHEKLGMSQETINDINIAPYKYIQDGKKQRVDKASIYTSKYLKKEKLVSVPYDKGRGFCLMKEDTYKAKLEDITNGPQFEMITKTRKNGKNIILKEEERINNAIKSLEKEGKINATLAACLTSKGAKLARLYGLANIHKENTLLRPC